jgi:magnesium transporter
MESVSESAQPVALVHPRIEIVYRSSAGVVNLCWPVDRVAEAIADSEGTTWVDVQAPETGSDLSSVEKLFLDVFHFHPLAIDDALKEAHIPKIDDWGGYLYSVFYSIDFDAATEHLKLCELDIFLGSNYLVTYHAAAMPMVSSLKRLLERDGGDRMRHGPDHLMYLILDNGVDHYLGIIERLDEAIDLAQEEVFHNPSPRTLQQIFRIKRSALKLHRVIGPQREVVNRLARDEYPQIDAADRVYFRDVYDHLVRLHDITETLRDLISGALDTYLSAISNRTNEVMKTLTIVTVLFLPMTFLAGFFGMNFFGESLSFHDPLPKALLFWATCALMTATPVVIGAWAKWRGWF